MTDWVQVDETNLQVGAKVGANGVATAKFPAVESNEKWEVNRAVVACTGLPGSSAILHIVTGGSDPSPNSQRSGTQSGSFDEADYPSSLLVLGDEQLICQWINASPGESAVCTITYDRYAMV